MNGQITWFPSDQKQIDTQKQADKRFKRRWENAFQKWSDNHGMQEDCTESWGACGYGVMCDWCEDNSYGRPCVRALNAMCREKGISIDYSERDFEQIWNMERRKPSYEKGQIRVSREHKKIREDAFQSM